MLQSKIIFAYTYLFFALGISSIARSVNTHNPAPVVVRGFFSGRITDVKTNNPIQGASVLIVDMKAGGTSNADGYFQIHNIPEGRHLIEVSHIGYTTLAEQVEITSDTKKDYTLVSSVVENSAVIITGVGAATQLKKSPFQVSLLRRDDLLQTTSSNIIESLAKLPGVSTLSTGPAISKPVIRGLGYNRVLTINDGVRQEGQQWGDEHGIEIDESSVNKVEVLKGPASLIYGSDAIAGVINIITNVPVENNSIKANILSSYQTNNNSRLLNANVAGNVNGFNWNIYGSTSAAADYKNKYDGSVFNSKFNQANFGGYAGYNGNWGYSHLLVSNFNLKAGLVEGERDDEGYFIKPVAGGNEVRATDDDFKSSSPQIPYQHIRHFKIATDNSFKFNKSRLSVNVGYQQNKREEFGNPDDLNERALFFDLKTITYTAQLHLPEMNGFKTSIGVNGMQQQNSNKGVEQLVPDYSLFDIGGFVYTQKAIDKITLSGGARYDNRYLDVKPLMDGTDVKGEAFKKSFGNFSGSIGLAAQLSSKVNFKVNAARGFRAPSIPELASNGAHEGTIRYEYGDANLKSETSTQLDAGVEFNTEHISLNVSAFYNRFNNFVFYRKLQTAGGMDSLITQDGNQLTAFKFGQTNATLSGIEAILDIHPHPLDWLHFENTFSLTNGKLNKAIESSNNLPFMPAPRLISELRCNFNKATKGLVNFYAKIELDNTFRQNKIFAAYNTETATPGYSLLNAGIGADVVNSKGTTLFSLHLAGMNLTDVAYQNHLSRLKYGPENLATGRIGVFNMGRNFSVKLNIPFSAKLKAKSS
jgi:iron complex outermembrane recepter protein